MSSENGYFPKAYALSHQFVQEIEKAEKPCAVFRLKNEAVKN